MYIHITAHPNSKKEKIEKLKENYFEVWVKEKAEKNLANKRILEILSKHFNKAGLRIISGHHSPKKIISIP